MRDELPQFVDVEPRGVDHHVGELADRLHQRALAAQPLAHRAVVAQRMRPPRLAEPAQQGFIGGLDEYQRRRHIPPDLLVDRRQAFELIALARVHQQRRALHFGIAINVQFAEGGDQVHRQVIHAVVAQIFEGLENGAFARAAQAGEDHQLPAVRSGAAFHVGWA